MRIFASESELSATLDRFDRLVAECARGSLPFWEFEARYDTFYQRFALDGHSSDPEEQTLLAGYEARIALHRDVWEEVLTRVCSDEDAQTPAYIAAGRFGSDEAVACLREILDRHSQK